MRRKTIVITSIAVFLLATAWIGLADRQTLREEYARWRRGPVPSAISREELLRRNGLPTKPAKTENATATKTTGSARAAGAAPPPVPARPKSVNLKVAFIPQAPLKNWDEVHEDACEEASMLMAASYLGAGIPLAKPADMDRAILSIVDYENKTYGDYKSTDAERTADIMKALFSADGIAAYVSPISSIDDVKRMIALGDPVILPAAGKLLYNPNFRNGGPLYHMLVAKGYTEDGRIITNDPGTRLGADYVYDEKTLWNAIHDWNGGDVLNGRRVMIVTDVARAADQK